MRVDGGGWSWMAMGGVDGDGWSWMRMDGVGWGGWGWIGVGDWGCKIMF